MKLSALPAPPIPPARSDLIWLGEADPQGRPLDPAVKKIAYAVQPNMARYRANEMTDEAEVASLIEEAVYRTSKVATEQGLADPASYLFRTYTRLVDARLRRTVRAFGMETPVLANLARSSHPEREMVQNLACRKLIEYMDEKGQALWTRHLLGYGLEDLAAEEGQTREYLTKRLRRATERALYRLQHRTSTGS